MTISRRTFLELSAGAGFIAAARTWRDLRAETQTRIMATIPSTGEQVPAIGIGTRDYRSNTDATGCMKYLQRLSKALHIGGIGI